MCQMSLCILQERIALNCFMRRGQGLFYTPLTVDDIAQDIPIGRIFRSNIHGMPGNGFRFYKA